jgi:uncharacterized protein
MGDLQSLYARIPAVKGCKTDCSGCCGPVPMVEAERASIKHMIRPHDAGTLYEYAITPTKPDCMTCAYSTSTGCAIYNDRPLLCRLFGASEAPRMRCPYGASAKRPLTEAETAQIMVDYRALSLTPAPKP